MDRITDAGGADDVRIAYEAVGLSKSFSSVPVLRDVSINFQPGEIHSLVGENGAGKSTLVKILSGVYALDKGRRILNGEEIGHLTPAEGRKRGIYLVPQEPRLMPDLSVAENLYLGALPPGRLRFTVDWKRTRDAAGDLLATVGLHVDPRMMAGQLPLAHQQLLECARALAHGCHVIFFDEPTSPLTAHEAGTLFALMRRLRERGYTLGFISHRLDEVEDLSDRITVLRDGQVVAEHERGVSRSKLVEQMVGRSLIVTKRAHDRGAIGDVVLDIVGAKSAPEVRSISLQVRKGEIVGLAGLVGSGRTELSEAVFGLRPLQEGKVTLNGRDITGADPEACISAGLVYLAEDRGRNGIFAEVDLSGNATSSIIDRLPRRLKMLRKNATRKMARDVLETMHVRAANIDLPIKSLSGGNQQKVMLARWVLAHPKVAIFDEPTRGVDVGAKEGIYEIIENLAGQGLATLVISSELEELVRLCDRIYAVYEGQVVGELADDDISVDAVGQLAVGAS